ncbi:hypothetical protein VNO77_05611 [Canavalia gladiata]|uniref:Uncharacterized protein n=1 Tax=Canavalia gladiata TaxID=3824 RepID=A0AAN9R8U7_CANGL
MQSTRTIRVKAIKAKSSVIPMATNFPFITSNGTYLYENNTLILYLITCAVSTYTYGIGKTGYSEEKYDRWEWVDPNVDDDLVMPLNETFGWKKIELTFKAEP